MSYLVENYIHEALRRKVIAVVGLSRDPGKDSHIVAQYLMSKGYRIVPVNPVADHILGERSYRSLMDVPPALQNLIEVVDVFRPSSEVPAIVDQVLGMKGATGRPEFLWTQLGIEDANSAYRATRAGVKVIMNRCMMIEHMRRSKNLDRSHSE